MADRPDNVIPLTPDVRSAVEEFGSEHNLELLTILFTDLVDSTKLQSDLGNIESARLTELHRKIVREELAKHNGREIEWAGDSCLAVFSKPSEAVTFALKMQTEHRRVRDTELRLPLVRVGIHLGEIVVKKRDDGGKKTEDLFGLQVSETARVMSVARGNQIYCTRTVFDNAKGALKGSTIEGAGEVVWVNYGAFMLKGSEDPVELCEIGSSEIAILKAPQTSDKVRPLVVDGSDGERATGHSSESMGRKVGLALAAVAVIALTIFMTRLSVREPSIETKTPEPTEFSLEPEPLPEPRPIRRLVLPLMPDEPLQPRGFGNSTVAFSNDGSLLVYVGKIDGELMLVTRRLDDLDTRVLAGTEGAAEPFFSPDGKWIAFFADLSLKKIRADGGAPVTLARCTFPTKGHWLENDTILFAPDYRTGIYTISAEGGAVERLWDLEEGEAPMFYFFPHLLPGGEALLFTRAVAADVNQTKILLRNLDTGEESILATGAARAQYARTGHIVFIQEGRVAALPFDLDALKVTGPAAEVSEELMTDLVSVPYEFDFSGDGTLVYAPGGTATSENVRRSLLWVDRGGNAEPVNAPLRAYNGPRISPDGNRLAIDIRAVGTPDIWVFDLKRATPIRVTTDTGSDMLPSWALDGEHLLFSSNRSGSVYKIFRVLADGTSTPEAVTSTYGPNGSFTPSLTPDGDTILFSEQMPGGPQFDVYSLSLDGESEPQALISTRFSEGNASVSPNGEWVVYSSDESGQIEVYVQAYPDLGRRTQISSGGGASPVWSHDGSELFYRSSTAMMAVKIQLSPTFEAGIAEELFPDEYYRDPQQSRSYDVSPVDGRFLMMKEITDGEVDPRTELMLVENWFEELNRLAPHPEGH